VKEEIHDDNREADEQDHAPGYIEGGEYGLEEEQYVNEADWGKDKEEGIGEEKENDME
jgi:hypothetical protein